MPVIVVANPKGGAGKSTLATQLAGYLASRGHAVMLGDLDRQQSSRLWLGLRPDDAAPIRGWDMTGEGPLKPPKGTTHVVIDTPAALRGKKLANVLRVAHRVLVPVQASVFDMHATSDFLAELAEHKHAARAEVGIVGVRVDARTIAADRLRSFVETTGLPVLGHLRNTQTYVHLAAQGLSLFDVAGPRVARDLAQWQGICQWVDAAA